MFSFGSGVLIGTRTDIANATPINFGLVQEVQLDLQFTAKELYGQYQFPVAIARGQGKATGKAKMARVSGLTFNNLFFGASLVPGQLATAFGEAQSVPASTPFTVSVTNAGQWQDDCGVVYAASGLPLTKVASAPTAGQYSVAAGVYTFNSADAGAAVLISYTYNVTGSGQQLTLVNPLLGTTPTFQAQLYTSFQGKPVNVKLFNCVSSKLTFASKLEDFVIPELDFDIFANAAGNVLQWSFAEVS
ncbi:MAG TPA: hypothetical protein VN766_17475 [Stellaceae bacterium]|jgi:hypothetical protein|nr:hypothetical protein [Stellaceae bacterium]